MKTDEITNAPLRFFDAARNTSISDWPHIVSGCLNPRILAIRIYIELPSSVKSFLRSVPRLGRLLASNSQPVPTPGVERLDECRSRLVFGGKELVFVHQPGSIGDLHKVFFREGGCSECRGRMVVEMGANIGSTAVRLVLEGAEKVYAFEPYPVSFRMACQNIKNAGLDGRAEIIRGGLATEEMEISIPADFKGLAGTAIRRFENGERVRLLPIGRIADEYGLRGMDPVLLCDCEGGEYSLLKAKPADLRVFETIMMEYHYGHRDLKKCLENAGFGVAVEKPAYNYNYAAGRRMLLGNLRAQRMGR